jgi:hypothetical protein
MEDLVKQHSDVDEESPGWWHNAQNGNGAQFQF